MATGPSSPGAEETGAETSREPGAEAGAGSASSVAHDPSFITRVLSRAKSLEGQGELVSRMVTQLATEIIEGRLPAGYDLTSVDLGKRFGTSRTPVHQALAVLQREGLVEVPPRRRARVATLTLEEIRDLYEIRSALYSLMSESIVEGADDEAVQRLDEPLARMRGAVEAGDRLGYFYLTVDFRLIEAEICPNRRVGSIIESLGLRIYQLRRYGLSLPGRMEVSRRDYSSLREAYRDRDRDLAVAVTRALMRKALTVIEANWEEGVPEELSRRGG
ncbi:MAG TPA: GntR family transcriptional regulator [Streptomyces sp.]|nr:GntR family transcriptional regulator [Streptomyces sp.]